MKQDIYSYITTEKAAYHLPITLENGWQWCMPDHIKTSRLYKHSQLVSGKNDDTPVKNITRPILKLQYRAEGIDVKDIEIFINSYKYYYKSFLVRKYHQKWARENSIDTFLDELVESYVDYGGTLVRNVGKKRPVVVPLESIIFCDQTNLLSGPFGIMHYFSPGELKEMEKKGWGNPENGATGTVDELIVLAQDQKTDANDESKPDSKTPGKYIEVVEVNGSLPESFLKDDGDPENYVYQTQYVAFYYDKDRKKQGFTLYKAESDNTHFKLLLRDKIYNRALGFGGAEELFDPQIWTTYGVIRMKQLLDAASKIAYQTTDAGVTERNKIDDEEGIDNNEIIVLEEGKTISQIDTFPRSIGVFDKSVSDWEMHAQQMGSANDALLGVAPSSGTPFKLQELVTAEGKGEHYYRQGQISTFVDEIYRDWVIPFIVRDIVDGAEFISDLSLKEIQYIADNLVVCEAEKMKKELVLSGKDAPGPEEIELFKTKVREQFMRGGKKRFLKILKGEMEDAPLDVFTNIAGKQFNMAGRVDKLVNVFRQILANPNVLRDPLMADLFNQIVEASGLSPFDFNPAYVSSYAQPQSTSPQTYPQSATSTEPLKDLAKSVV